MIRVLQCNTNRCRAAHDLLDNTLSTRGYEVCIVSEPNRARADGGRWIVDQRKDVGIWVSRSAQQRRVAVGGGRGYVWVDMGAAVFYSCYVSPNVPLTEFESYLDELERSVATWSARRLVIVAGDFNSASVEWGSRATDVRGTILLEMALRRGLRTINDGRVPTFSRCEQESYLDLTFCPEDMGNRVEGWRVLEQETLSDHRYLEYSVREAGGTTSLPTSTALPAPTGGRPSWSAKKLNLEVVRRAFSEERGLECPVVSAVEVSRFLQEVCEKAATGVHPRSRERQPRYWWTLEIAEARRTCVKLHRRHQRLSASRRDPEAAAGVLDQYRATKKQLRRLIQRSKERCWVGLCEEVERDPFGKAYRIVTQKMGAALPKLSADLTDRVVGQLFPQRPAKTWDFPSPNGCQADARYDFSPVTEEEVKKTAKRISTGKAPGVDGVPPEVVKIFMETRPEIFGAMINGLIQDGTYPGRWKNCPAGTRP